MSDSISPYRLPIRDLPLDRACHEQRGISCQLCISHNAGTRYAATLTHELSSGFTGKFRSLAAEDAASSLLENTEASLMFSKVALAC